MNFFDRLVALGLLVIGGLHCYVTFQAYKELSLGAIWFFSAGLALMMCAGLNYLRIETGGAARWMSALANMLMLGAASAAAWVMGMGRMKTELQIPVLLVLLALATLFSFKGSGRGGGKARGAGA